MKVYYKLLVPYLAVVVFWCLFSNGWLAIVAYHAQIVLCSCQMRDRGRGLGSKRMMLLAMPAAAAGPLLFFLFPYITRAGVHSWLAEHGLSGISLLLMIPYFGLVHPFLEQLHWGPLRRVTPLAHFGFAGYHMLVLWSLLTVPWLVVCFTVLVASSYLWRDVEERSGSLAMPILSHILADLGIVVAAWLYCVAASSQ